MCAISGAIAIEHSAEAVVFNGIMQKASERGRDSVGIYSDGNTYKRTTKEIPTIHTLETIALANNRGEPTTEYVENKNKEDVQPYSKDGIVVVHNGTIANDKDIAQELGIEKPNIDSKIIPELLAAKWDHSFDHLLEILKKHVIGSYAFGIYSERTQTLFLVSNYKPIYTEVLDGALYFSSLDKFLPGFGDLTSAIHKVEPYSAIAVKAYSKTIEYRKLNNEPLNKKALVVCSGGLDSTVVATKMVNDGYDVTLLHIKYKARAEENEIAAIEAIGKRLDVPVLFVETDVFKNVIKASRLTGTHEGIADGEAGAELAYEWVPARNTIMLSIAIGIAEARGIETIALGNNLEEAGAYADNEQEFIYQFNKLIPNAINLDKRLVVIEPVGNLMKHEIVKLGLEQNAPLDLTWSCYNAGKLHCGVCGPCYMRRHAFEMLGKSEVIVYNK